MFTFKYKIFKNPNWSNSRQYDDDIGALLTLSPEQEQALLHVRSHVDLPEKDKQPLTDYLLQTSALKTQRPLYTVAYSCDESGYNTLHCHDPLSAELIPTDTFDNYLMSTPYYDFYDVPSPSNYDNWRAYQEETENEFGNNSISQYDARICTYQLAEWIQLKLLNMARGKDCINNFIQYIEQHPNACIDKITFMAELLLREDKFIEFLELYNWAKKTYDVDEYYTSRELATLLVSTAKFTQEPDGGKITLQMENIEYQSKVLPAEASELCVKLEFMPPDFADSLAFHNFTLGMLYEDKNQRLKCKEHFKRLFHFGLPSKDTNVVQCCQRAATALTMPQIKCDSMAKDLLLDVKYLGQSPESLMAWTELTCEKQMQIDAQAKEIKELKATLEQARVQASTKTIPGNAPSFFSPVVIDNSKKTEPTEITSEASGSGIYAGNSKGPL